MDTKYYNMIIILLVLIILTSFARNSITNNAVLNINDLNYEVKNRPAPLLFKGYDSEVDFPNDFCGTVNYRGNFSPEFLEINMSNPPEYLVIFKSHILADLEIIYDIDEQKFKAGLPEMESSEIDLFSDKEMHKISYSFCKDTGIQKMFFDCKELISGPFKGTSEMLATGFTTKEEVKYNEVLVEGEFEFFDSAVIPEP